MTEREMRRLSRADLLEMLIEQSTELEELRTKYAEAVKQLEKRQMDVQQAGTLAEAALRFNGVFDAADAAAKEYMDAVRVRSEAQTALCEQLERESKEAAEQLKRESEATAEQMKRDSEAAAEQLKNTTQQQCSKLEEDTKIQCAEMVAKAKAESEEYWNQISVKLDAYCEQYNGIRELLSFVMEKQTKN